LRAELLGQVLAAQFEIEHAMAEYSRLGAADALALGGQQLQQLVRMQRQIGTADPVKLAGMGAQVAASVAAARATIQQSRAVADNAATAETADIVHAAAEAHAQAASIFHDLRRFDPSLHFVSAEDEDAYRQHEAERSRFAAAQLAKGTPQGDLNGAGAAVGQMVDAHAHGAGDSPEFQQRWNELVATTGNLRDAVRRSGGSTAEFDNRLRADLRTILKAKGLSDAQIDAQFAGHPDPLEAAKAYVAGEDELGALREHIDGLAQERSPASPTAPEASGGPAVTSLDHAMAGLRAAGIIAKGDHTPADGFAHGVPANAPPTPGTSPSL